MAFDVPPEGDLAKINGDAAPDHDDSGPMPELLPPPYHGLFEFDLATRSMFAEPPVADVARTADAAPEPPEAAPPTAVPVAATGPPPEPDAGPMPDHDWPVADEPRANAARLSQNSAGVGATEPTAASDLPDLLSQHFSDIGNALRIVVMHGSRVRFCHDFNKWLLFDGRRWDRDTADGMRKLAQATMIEFAQQAWRAGKEAASKFAGSCFSTQRLNNAMREAQPHLAISAADLDTNPYLLNFLNGTVDLRTGDLLPHDSAQYITKIVHHDYDPNGKCPQWVAFLHRIIPGLEKYIQLAAGYSLTGDTSAKVVFICHGSGNNGKTTLLSTLHRLIEEYAVLLQVETLMVHQETNNSQADLADLRGARFAMTSETEEGQRLSEGKLKRITQGMGTIKATRKYENPIEFAETHKLWMDSNHKPVIRGTDNAIWNRLHLIPFGVTIDPDAVDDRFGDKLLTEASGILAWAVVGSAEWYKTGLKRPEKVDEASKEWRTESDQIGRFIEDRCNCGDGFRAKARHIYDEYRRWADAGGEKRSMTANDFGATLISRGFNKEHTREGNVYLGIAVRNEA